MLDASGDLGTAWKQVGPSAVWGLCERLQIKQGTQHDVDAALRNGNWESTNIQLTSQRTYPYNSLKPLQQLRDAVRLGMSATTKCVNSVITIGRERVDTVV